jgi:Fic family protein
LRTSDKNIGVAWQQVETSLFTLMNDLNFWEANATFDLLEQAMLLHHRSVQIHPFENGNGRWSRLLANIWLKRHDHPLTEWPEETVGEQSTIRDEYLQAIRRADDGEYGLLRDMHRRLTNRSSR